MNCVCGVEIDGKLVIVDPNLKPNHIPVCSDCMNLWANHEYDKLSEKLEVKN